MPEARTESNSKLVENDHPSTSKWKQSLAQIKKISEVRTDNNSPLVENTYLSTSKWKQSLIQIRRMAKTQTDNNSQLLDNDQSSTIKQLQNEMEDKNPKTTLNSIQMTVRSFDFLANKGLIKKQQKFVFSLSSKMYVELDMFKFEKFTVCIYLYFFKA
jgi:hypothetical protein